MIYKALVGDGKVSIIIRFLLGAATGAIVHKGWLTAEQAATVVQSVLDALPTWLIAAVPAGLAVGASVINKKVDTENKVVKLPAEGGQRFSSFASVQK